MNNEIDVQKFNHWFGNNYRLLQKYCKKYHIPEDSLQDVYISTHDRIVRSGYTESFYMTYVKRSIRNLIINEKIKLKKRYFVDYDNEDYTNTIESALQVTDEIEKDTAEYREDVMFFSRMMFKYIQERQYNEEYQFVFRSYYLMPKRFTYAKLTLMTGINKNRCTKIIQTMKQDIRNGFLDWLKTQK